MADTKISALTAAGAAAAANELAINEAGTSKKVTAAQLKTFVNNAPIFGAGSASAGTKPTLTSGTLLTTPEAGAIEYDGQVIYGTEEAGNRGVIPTEHLLCLSAAYTLTSQTASQKLFNQPTNGALTLATGTYFFEALIALSAMSATSGNALINILGAGTAVLGTSLTQAQGVDGGTATAATQTGSFYTGNSSPASVMTAGTGTGMCVRLYGTFRVTTAGTIIPSISLVTAAAAIVTAGSFFRCYCIGGTGVNTVGDWS